jgi:hypothetical protein
VDKAGFDPIGQAGARTRETVMAIVHTVKKPADLWVLDSRLTRSREGTTDAPSCGLS